VKVRPKYVGGHKGGAIRDGVLLPLVGACGLGAVRLLTVLTRYRRDLIVAAVPGAALLPLPGEFDALPWGETAHIERGDMKPETTIVGRLVHRVPPAAMTPVDFGGAWQRDGKPGAGMKFPDWRMRPPERIAGSRSAPLIAPPDRTRPVYRVPEMARHHQLYEFGMRPDERHRRS
jgi:hypothetical protein